MNFLVVGPGAMGCLFAARLKRAGFEVILLDHDRERARLINETGISVEGVTGQYAEKVPVVTEGPLDKVDFVLVCVKAYNTEQAGQAVKALIRGQATVVTLQNGVGNLDILRGIFGKKSVLGGVTAEGATLLAPGKIRHAGRGDTVLGPTGPAEGAAEGLVSVLNRAGFQARAAEDVDGLIWGKLIVNIGINPLTALLRVKNGRLPELGGARRVLEEAVREAAAVAEAKGIELPFADPVGRVVEVCRATSGNIASMLQDVLKEKRTEVDFISGAVVREAETLGIPAPVNRTLASLIKSVEESYRERL